MRPRASAPVAVALQDAMQRFGVPAEPLRELVAGCATDLEPSGPADEAGLELYCYRVASCVGLTCLPVLGADSEGGRRYAIALGHALQLTNVLRDLRGDGTGTEDVLTDLEQFSRTAAAITGGTR